MKKISILLFAILLVGTTAFAQDGKKALKEAARALNSFNLGGQTDGEKLQEAISAIDVAVEDAEIGKTAKAWITRGKIYNAVVTLFTAQSVTDKGATALDPAASSKAYNSFQKALEFAEKKWEKRDALKGLSEGISNLNNTGFAAYEDGDYAKAYESFSKVLGIHKTLKENEEPSGLDDPATYNDQVNLTGLAALGSGNYEAAGPLFEELVANDFEEASVYSSLYKVNIENNPEKALKFLEEGRDKYPEDVNLLFDEINYYISKGEMNVLEDRLKKAIAKEPENASLYITLGRIYSDLSDKSREAGDEAAEQDYFNKATEQFSKSIEVNGKEYGGWYQLGELYYNKAARINTEMEKLTMSREDQKKYAVMKDEMMETFDKSLPNFMEAEKRNPNDNNTLVALSSIYAIKGDFDKVNEFKQRIENLGAGKENESYFKNN
ncbi:MAG: hypothetical protein AAF847_02015 [Bacteroidota bacterium]